MLKKLLISFSLLLLSFQVWGATKYVSPDGSALWAACTTTAAPCSIATAQTSAAAGDVIMLMDGTYTTGINTGTNGTAGAGMITWQAVNAGAAILAGYASGQTDKVLVVDNAYHRFDGITIAVQTGPGSAHTYGLFVSAATYTEFVNGEIYFAGDETTLGAAYNAYCAQLRSATLFEDNYVHNCTYGTHLFSTTAGHATIVQDNIYENMIVGDYEDSDCMAVNGSASYDWTGAIIQRNECSGYRDDGIDLSNADNVQVLDNTIHGPIDDAGENSSCIKIGFDGSDGNIARRNYCYDIASTSTSRNYGMVATGPNTAIVESNIFVGGYTCFDVAQRNAAGGIGNVFRNNTCSGFSVYGIQVYAGATSTVMYNNIFDGATNDIVVASTLTATGANNLRVNGTTSVAGTYTQTGDIDGDPGFIGGTSPTTAAGFRLSASSALRRAGTELNIGNVQDIGNRAFSHPPSIGAWEVTSGDSASSRTTASTRTVRN